MKKVLMLILSICFILCACGEKPQEITLEIPFQKVAACNNRTRLLEKYSSISERTASRPIGEENFSYRGRRRKGRALRLCGFLQQVSCKADARGLDLQRRAF